MASRETTRQIRIKGLGTISVSIPAMKNVDPLPVTERVMKRCVNQSAVSFADRARGNAPVRTGDLQRGIAVHPDWENSSEPGKFVMQVGIDAALNVVFVKMTRDGKRYYYPASQEYGFRISTSRRVPGKYYMRDAAVESYASHRDRVVAGVDEILEELL